MNWTKSKLNKEIIECKMGIDLSNGLLKTIKEFEHREKVNKTFVDKLKERGYHAFIQKDNHSTTFYCSISKEHNQYRAEIRCYVSQCFNASPLTWDRIKKEIETCSFDKRLIKAQERMILIDQEIEKAKEILSYLKNQKLECFDFYRGIHEIEDALREQG